MNQAEKKYLLQRLQDVYAEKNQQIQDIPAYRKEADLIRYQIDNGTIKAFSVEKIVANVKESLENHNSSLSFSDVFDLSKNEVVKRQLIKDATKWNKGNSERRQLLKAKFQEAKDSVMLGEFGMTELQKFIDFVA